MHSIKMRFNVIKLKQAYYVCCALKVNSKFHEKLGF
jgi:hypothetical protein